MSTSQNTFHTIVKHAAIAVTPLKEAVSDIDKFKALLYAMGWQTTDLTVPSAYSNLVSSIDQVINAVNSLSDPPDLNEILDLLEDIKQLYTAIKQIQTAPSGSFTAGTFLAELPQRLAEYLAIRYIEDQLPKIYYLLRTLGIIISTDYPEITSPPDQRPAFTRLEFKFNNLQKFIDNPVDLLKLLYDWGLADMNFNPIMSLLQGFFVSKGIAATVEWNSGEGSDAYGYTQDSLMPHSRAVLTVPFYSFFFNDTYYELGFQLFKYVEDQQSGLLLQPLFPTSISQDLQVTDDTMLAVSANSNIASLFGVDINPNGIVIRYPGAPGTALPQAGFGATLKYAPSEPLHLLGNPAGSRIELSGAEFAFLVEYLGDGFEVQLDAAIKDLSIVLSGGDGDGFISKILGNVEKRFDTELGINWSNTGGLRFRGAGGFELQLNPHIQLGPIAIENLKVAIQAPPSTPAKAKLMAAAGLKLTLGPFTAVVDEIGLELALTFASGNAGPFDIRTGFKPPTGLGLSIKTETVTGAGYLSFNKDEGRYVGALELSIKKKIAIKAIGILTTKLPGGQSGYSLLLLITAEFQPIQLGFGFTLNGVGGLIALHRRMDTEVLRKGVREGTLDNILFPKDPVENISSIISTLESAFPIQEGRYSFGPMAIIGWGTPTLITAELGLFFELPDANEIALIGIIKAILPKEDKPILKLQIAFAGIINFEKKSITFDASLFDSSVAGMPLSGDMIFRLRWGDQPTFVLSVGGFHPKFPIPPLNIPDMRRLTVNLLDGDSPRLTLSTYFAITSNTAQFGAAIDFYWAITGNIDIVGHLGYDALFYFSPFRFIATMEGSLEVRRKSKAMLSLWFAGLLEGPTPWHVQGSVGFKILGIDYEKDFDKTFGQRDATTLPDVEVLPQLVAALQDKKNWQAKLSEEVPLLVTVRELNTPGADPVVHPQGSLAVSQKVVPLDIDISRFGNCRPAASGYSYFNINLGYDANPANVMAKTDLKEFFSPNEYFELSESERLNRPSFEEFRAGVQITSTSTALTTGGFRRMEYLYETIVMDQRIRPERVLLNTTINQAARTAFGGGNAASNSPLNAANRARSVQPTLQAFDTGMTYAIARTSDLSHYNSLTASTQTEVQALLERELELNPALEGTLQIVNFFELVP